MNKSTIKKVLMYSILGPIALLFAGSFKIMDLILVPMLAGVFEPLIQSFTGGEGLGSLFGGANTAGATT